MITVLTKSAHLCMVGARSVYGLGANGANHTRRLCRVGKPKTLPAAALHVGYVWFVQPNAYAGVRTHVRLGVKWNDYTYPTHPTCMQRLSSAPRMVRTVVNEKE